MSRFSNLSSPSIKEQIKIVEKLFHFFSPRNSNSFHVALGKEIQKGIIKPLSLSDFLDFCKRVDKEDLNKELHNINIIIKKMLDAGYLTHAGSTGNPMFALGNCYYSCKEMTNLQSKGNFWLTEILGFNFLIQHIEKSVVHLTGITKNGDIHSGTGLVIDSKYILTCAHVINDMSIDEYQELGGVKYKVKKSYTHPQKDVGIIELDTFVSDLPNIPFNHENILDSVLIVGYPRVPQSINPVLLAQRGEVNGRITDFEQNSYFLYSIFTKPGNSGGPIFNDKGYLVGIVTREFFNPKIEYNNVQVPFCSAVPSDEILKAIKDVNIEISLEVEDYS